ncbi:P-loop NTPase [Streptomyces sp. NPDC002926]
MGILSQRVFLPDQHPDAEELLRTIIMLYPRSQPVEGLVQAIGLLPAEFRWDVAMATLWPEVLARAASAGRLRQLVELLRDCNDGYPLFARLLAEPDDSVDDLISPEEAEIAAQAAEQLPGVTVMTPEDREPDTVTHEAEGFLVGDQPKMYHLRSGYFAPNRRVVDAIEADLTKWLKGLANPSARRKAGIPVFWITGASGAGKSILLLQLLARLNEDPQSSVLWLGGNLQPLPDATAFAAEKTAGRRIVIGIDDPYLPSHGDASESWGKAFAALERFRQQGQLERLPVFVCCAPSEHMDKFINDYGSQVEARSHRMNLPGADEISRLAQWFAQRTGRQAETSTELNVLPVQIFFEWWHGEGLKDFARKFQKRLELGSSIDDAVSLKEVVYRIIALNRLYLGYPTAGLAGLTDVARDTFRRFEDDLHFGPGPGRRDYWLTHPHLANLLFETWFSSEETKQRAGHLRAAFLDAVVADRNGNIHAPLLRALVSLYLHGDKYLEEPEMASSPDRNAALWRLDTEEFPDVIARVSKVLTERYKELGMQSLAAWVEAESASAECVRGWSPLREALSRVESADRTTVDVESLVRSLMRVEKARAAVLGFLGRELHWRRWAALCSELIAARPVPQVCPVIRAGVGAAPTDEGRLTVLWRAMEMYPEDEDLAATARDVLASGHVTQAVGRVAAAYLKVRPADGGAVRDWVVRFKVRRHVGPALGALAIKRGEWSALVHDAARSWVSEWAMEPDAGAVLAKILPSSQMNPKIGDALHMYLASTPADESTDAQAAALAWLTANPANSAWAFIWCAMPHQVQALDTTQESTLSWLRQQTRNKGWTRVWQTMAVHHDTPAAQLVEVADRWFGSHREGEPWAGIMVHYVRICDASRLSEALDKARAWLLSQPDSERAWPDLFTACLYRAEGERRAEFLQDAVEWLAGNCENPRWSYVWRAATRQAVGTARTELLRQAHAWLSDPATQPPGWRQVYFDYLPACDDEAEDARSMGERWISQNFDSDDWPAVFTLLALSLPDDTVVQRLSQWLRATECDRPVGHIWKVLFEDGMRASLLADEQMKSSILDWLRRNGKCRSWWYMWLRSHTEDPENEDLIQAALCANVSLGRSFGIANRLGKSMQARPRVADVVVQMLSQSPDTATWILVWGELLTRHPANLDDRIWSLGLRWLEAHTGDWLWPTAWSRLWEAPLAAWQRDLLMALGLEWCREADDHPSWPVLWSYLVGHGGDDHTALLDMGQRWLRDPVVSGKSKFVSQVAEIVNATPSVDHDQATLEQQSGQAGESDA